MNWGSISTSIVEFIERIPLLGPIVYFRSAHRKAYREAAFLWIVGALPVLFAVLLKLKSTDPVLQQLRAEFSLPSQFIYTATFLAPVLAMTLKRMIECEDGIVEGWKTLRVFPGHWIVFIVSVVVLIATAAAYAAYIEDPKSFGNTTYTALLGEYSLVIYGISVYFWYISLLDTYFEYPDFAKSLRDEEKSVGDSFSNHMKNR